MKCTFSIKYFLTLIAVISAFQLYCAGISVSSLPYQSKSDSTKNRFVKGFEKDYGKLFHSDSAKRVKHYLHEQHKFTKGSKDYPYVVTGSKGKVQKVKVELKKSTHLKYEVMGWYPFWEDDLYKALNFSLLSTTAYFDYELDPDKGRARTMHDWSSTNFIDSSKAAGNSVLITVTNFGGKNNKKFLKSEKATSTFIADVIAVIQQRKADGVCIDFEGVQSSEKDVFIKFIKQLKISLNRADTKYMLYITLPCVDWSQSYDVKTLSASADRFVMMGYSYYGSFSDVAGPVSPNSSGKFWEPYNLEKSIDKYLSAGLPAEKLLVALGYFGAVWETDGKQKGAKAKHFIGDRTYDYIKANIKASVQYDDESQTAWYHYDVSSGSRDKTRQCWFDNDSTLGLKMDLIKKKGLKGMAIWALGYDKGNEELWSVIVEKMSAPGIDTTKNDVKDSTAADMDVAAGFWVFLQRLENAMGDLVDYKVTLAAILLFLVLFGGAGLVIAMLMPANREFFFGTPLKVLIYCILVICLLIFLLRLTGFLVNVDVAVVVGFICGVITLFLLYRISFKVNDRKP